MLEIKDLRKQFQNGKGIYKTSVEFKDGEITGILGRNGSGKTTLLKCILGLLEIDDGSILLHGTPVYEQYDRVCFISADGSSLPYFSAKEYGKFLDRYYKHFSLKYYNELLERFELDPLTTIRNFSKGQQMKLEIAAGFAMDAQLYILDEPFTSLDVYAKDDTIKLIIEHVKEDAAILISTHDIEELEQLADRCIVLDNGKMVDDINMDEIHEKGIDLKEVLLKYKPN